MVYQRSAGRKYAGAGRVFTIALQGIPSGVFKKLHFGADTKRDPWSLILKVVYFIISNKVDHLASLWDCFLPENS